MADYILETKDLSKRFGRLKAVDEVSMRIKAGEIYGLIGKNGAGKTTLMRMLAGLAVPDKGEILLNGSTQLHLQRKDFGFLIEMPAFYPHMTAMSNMKIQQQLRPGKTSIEELLKLLRIWDARNKAVAQFSLGMKQRLGIAMAMLGDPQFLVLDEPINGLDPSGIHELRETLKEINRQRGVTLMISSHILGELEKLATNFGIIDHGKMIKEFSASSIQNMAKKSLIVHVDDITLALDLLSEYQIAHEPESQELRVAGYESTAEINALLIRGGVNVLSLHEERIDLEDYFLSLTS